MTGLTPQLLGVFVASCGVAYLMVRAGVEKNALEWRRRTRSCPACGRRIEGRVCARCVG